MGGSDPADSDDEVVTFAGGVCNSADDFAIDEERLAPTVLDLWDGANFPIARALAWCGWAVATYDTAISNSHDLSKPALQDQLISEVAKYDFIYA